MQLSHEELLRVLNYDPLAGVFIWRVSLTNTVNIGDVAGNLMRGYWQIGIHNKRYLAHRLAWFYIKGKMPTQFIDHVNRNPPPPPG